MAITPISRRILSPALALLMLGALTTGCTSTRDTPQQPEDDGGGKQLSIVARAPVASEQELATSPTAQAIRARGVLVNGTETTMPLLSQRNPATGQIVGFDALLAKMLAKYIVGEPRVKHVTATGATREALLRVGTVDVVIHAYTITADRAEKVSFAGPYLVSGAALATLKKTDGINGLSDLKGRTVLAIKGATSVQAIHERVPRANIVTYKTAEQCVQALESGQGIAYVHDLTILAGNALMNSKIEIVTQPFTKEPYGIGIPHGDQAFKRFINDWLRKIQRAGLWKEAWEKTLGQVAGKPPEPPKIGSVLGS